MRQFGENNNGTIRRQVILGFEQDANGIPIHDEVFSGDVAEVGTLRLTLKALLKRFPIRRVIAVVDRGLMSTENLEPARKLT